MNLRPSRVNVWALLGLDDTTFAVPVEIRYLREAFGAAALFACGGGATAIGDSVGAWRIPVIAIGFGIGRVLAAMIVPGQRLTVNPATSLLLWISRRVTIRTLLLSIVVHIAAMTAVCAALTLVPGVTAGELVETTTSDARTVVVVGVLSVVWFAVLLRTPTLPVIGAAYVMVHLVGLPLGGGSLNPARTIAPVILSGVTASTWPFLLTPLLIAWALGSFGVRRARAHRFPEPGAAGTTEHEDGS